MFIVWRGKGPLVFLSIFLGSFLVVQIFDFLPIDTSYRPGFILQGIIVTGAIAFINYSFTKKFISDRVRVFIDEETGEKIPVKDNSSLFFIPNKYWTWLILIGGLLLTFGASTSLP